MAPDFDWNDLRAFLAVARAGRLTAADKLRILSGRPPVPVGRALACMSERAMLRPAA